MNFLKKNSFNFSLSNCDLKVIYQQKNFAISQMLEINHIDQIVFTAGKTFTKGFLKDNAD